MAKIQFNNEKNIAKEKMKKKLTLNERILRKTYMKRPKKIDWDSHKKWLEKNAQHRKSMPPPRNPIGRFNKDQAISKSELEAFLSRNVKLASQGFSVEELTLDKKKMINIKEFEKWYESRKKIPPSEQEPIRPSKSIKLLLKRIKQLSVPRKYIIQKPKSLKIRPAALTFRAGKAYAHLCTPKKDFTPEIPPVVVNKITKHAIERLDELSKHVPKKESMISNYNLRRWPFFPENDIRSNHQTAVPKSGSFNVYNKLRRKPFYRENGINSKQPTAYNKNKTLNEHYNLRRMPFYRENCIKSNQPTMNNNESNYSRNEKNAEKKNKLKQQKSNINVFVLVSPDSKCIIKPASPPEPEKSPCTGQCRIEELAKPSRPINIPFKDRPSTNQGIADRVLNHQPSNRILELSQPKGQRTVPYKVARAQKEAKSKALRDRRNQQRALKRKQRIDQKNQEILQKEWEKEQAAQCENEARLKRENKDRLKRENEARKKRENEAQKKRENEAQKKRENEAQKKSDSVAQKKLKQAGDKSKYNTESKPLKDKEGRAGKKKSQIPKNKDVEEKKSKSIPKNKVVIVEETESQLNSKYSKIPTNPSIENAPTKKQSVLNTVNQISSNVSATSKAKNSSQSQMNPSVSKISNKSNKIDTTASRLPEKVNNDIDYRSDLEDNRRGREFIEKTRNPVQKQSYSTQKYSYK